MIGDYLFHIGSFGVPSMGFCILIGTIAAMCLCYYIKRYTNLDWNDEILDGVIWAVIGGFIGMKVLYWIVTPDVFLSVVRNPSWKGVWELITSGMVFYGGLIGGVVGLLLLCKKKHRNFFTFADLIVPCFCLAHAGGRIGCLLVGCCYGVAEGQTCLAGHYTYHGTFAVTYLNGVHRLPVPLMESLFLVLLSAVLVVILKNNKHRGTVTAWYLILYSVWRFVIEYFRGDEIRGIYGPFSTSQWIGIAIFVAGVVILVLSRKWPKDEPFSDFREDDLTVPESVDGEEIMLDGEAEAEAAGEAERASTVAGTAQEDLSAEPENTGEESSEPSNADSSDASESSEKECAEQE